MRFPRTSAVLLALAGLLVFVPSTKTPAMAAPFLPSQDQHPRELMLERAFDVGAGGALEVDVHDADVEVVTGSSGGAQVEIYLRSNNMEWARGIYEQMEFSARLEGNRVIVESGKVPSGTWTSSIRGRWFGVRIMVRIPQRFDIDLNTADGDVMLGDVDGDVRIETADGDVSVGDIEGPGIWLRTADGDVAAGSLAAPSIEIDTSDGDISVAVASGRLSADTSDGDIRLRLESAEGASLSSGDGDVDVELVQSAALEISTGDGDVTILAPATLAAEIDFDGEEVEFSGGLALEGRVREGRASGTLNGGGPLIRVETGDGEIRLVTKGS